jgi:group I intron endonuclease
MARKPKDYANGKVYVIRNTENDKVYVGSTTQPLSKRMASHRSDMYNPKTQHYKIYQSMREIGVEKFYIELLELYPCNTQEELNKREGEFIRQHNSVVGGYNSTIAGRTKKEWCAENADKLREYQVEYRVENADKVREYRAENADKIREKDAKYRAENADKVRECQAKYRAENADKIAQYKAKYRAENADKVREYQAQYRLKKKQQV